MARKKRQNLPKTERRYCKKHGHFLGAYCDKCDDAEFCLKHCVELRGSDHPMAGTCAQCEPEIRRAIDKILGA